MSTVVVILLSVVALSTVAIAVALWGILQAVKGFAHFSERVFDVVIELIRAWKK
jgi:uncharacterized membrane protein